jgi:hypothetical protein
VTVAATNGATQVYNGTTNAAANLLTITNVVTGDTVTLSGTATLAGSGVGNEAISLTGLSLSNPNYTLTGGTPSGTVAVTARPVTVAATNGATQVYNGTTNAAANLLTITNVVTGDTVTLSGNATLAGSGVGNEAISLTGLTLSNPNYTLTGGTPSGTVAVTARPVTVAATNGATQVYNGTTNAAANLLTITNVVTGDTVMLSGNATLAGSGVGNQAISLTGLSLSNPNYTLTGGTPSGSVAVTAQPVTYTITLVNPGQTFTTNGQPLYDANSIATILNTAISGAPTSGSVTTTSYTLWENGSQVSAVQGAGTYEVRATLALNPTSPNYAIDTVDSTVLRFVVSPSAPSGTGTVIASALQQPTQIALPVAPFTNSPNAANSKGATFANVVNVPSAINTVFDSGSNLMVISSPSATEPTQVVSLAEVRALLQGGATDGDSGNTVGSNDLSTKHRSTDGSRDVRVPVSRHSLAEIVNGGVRLPSGVEQQLFVVQAN